MDSQQWPTLPTYSTYSIVRVAEGTHARTTLNFLLPPVRSSLVLHVHLWPGFMCCWRWRRQRLDSAGWGDTWMMIYVPMFALTVWTSEQMNNNRRWWGWCGGRTLLVMGRCDGRGDMPDFFMLIFGIKILFYVLFPIPTSKRIIRIIKLIDLPNGTCVRIQRSYVIVPLLGFDGYSVIVICHKCSNTNSSITSKTSP